MKKLKEMIMYIIYFILVFYLGPLILSGPASDGGEWYIILLYLYPICIFIGGLIFGFRHNFRWQLLLCIPLFYTTSSLIFNPDLDAAIVYTAIYLVILAITMLIGKLIKILFLKIFKRENNNEKY